MTHYIFSKKVTGLMVGIGVTVMAVIIMATPSSASAQTLTRQLQEGMSGSDVGTLQSFLAADRTIYPQGLVTSYFGPLTKSAVSNFQARNGIETVGRVGPITLSAINRQIAAGGMSGGGGVVYGSDMHAPLISNVSVNAEDDSATIAWNTNEQARGAVYYSTSPLMVSEQLTSVTITGATATGDAILRTSQNMGFANLQNDSVYYYMIHAVDANGNVSVTWPSTFRTDN